MKSEKHIKTKYWDPRLFWRTRYINIHEYFNVWSTKSSRIFPNFILDTDMITVNTRWLLLLTIISICNDFRCRPPRLRVYHEPSGVKCIWQDDAPFCFIGSDCSLNMITVKTDKWCGGDLCWIGYETYCCI